MQYKICQLRVTNFKCFDDSRFYEFKIDYRRNPVILSGPNGFGKTTFFDAIELIFSKKITRLETSIEKKNTNLGKNILLNKANKDGYVVVTLINEEGEYLTIFAVITQSVHKLIVDNAIKYGVKRGEIATESIKSFFDDYSDWRDDLNEFNVLKYSPQHFNVYYYVSQAESVHFLKKTISDRKDAMNVLLNTSAIDQRINYIYDRLIGRKSNSTGVLINDEINRIKSEISNKISLIKKVFSDNGTTLNTDVKYIRLMSSQQNEKVLFWDERILTEYSVSEIKSAIQDIEALHSFSNNEEDYKILLWNNRINKLLQGRAILDFIQYRKYIVDNKVSMKVIEDTIRKWDKISEIFSRSSLFRSEPCDVAKFKEEDLIILNRLMPELIDFDMQSTKNLVSEINNLGKSLSTRQTVIAELENARNALLRVKTKYDKESPVCPFCNQKYEDAEELSKAFEMAAELINEEKSSSLEQIIEKQKEFQLIIKNAKQKVLTILKDFDEEDINNLQRFKSGLNEFVSDINRVSDVEFLFTIIDGNESWKDLEINEMKIEIQRLITDKLKTYVNSEFMNEYDKYNFERIVEKYGSILKEKQEKLRDKKEVDSKITYLKKVIQERENNEIVEIKNEVKQKIIRLEKLKRVRGNLEKLQKIYNSSIEEYKDMVLKKLRVPLLIYTSKILQDYQNGLGVFINKKEMRFVATGDAKHDILNTFSSGQLSGFVLAFLFSMNKQYIKESADDIGFILIDDPVQTMDDINIASLIEVLRNDFANKQIILSTHETEKENYILYKFYKYSQIGQSFNVKESLYGV